MSMSFRCRVPLVLALFVLPLAGCQRNHAEIEPRPGANTDVLPADADNRAEKVRDNPLKYLHDVAETCRSLEQYTLTFVRHERRGMFDTLHGPEHIACHFRKDPFSVRMKWLDEDVKYGESVYVEGEVDDQVRFVTRYPVPLLKPPPKVNLISPRMSVLWGESKRPVTHFGLERLMNRTLAAIEKAGNDVIVQYEGTVQLPEDGPTAHHIHIEVPRSQDPVPIQELYVNVATDLPAGTVLRRSSGVLDAAYYYLDVDPSVELSDEDFLLPAERAAQATDDDDA